MAGEENGKPLLPGRLLPWLLTVLFGAGVAFAGIQAIPKINEKNERQDEKLADHETRITVIESHYSDIKAGLAGIRGDLRSMNSRARYIPAGRSVNIRKEDDSE